MAWLGWTEENKKEVERRFLAGESAGRIAADLRVPTRNMVVGVLNRLGLKRDATAKKISNSLGGKQGARSLGVKKVKAEKPAPKIGPFVGGWGVGGPRLEPTAPAKLRTVVVAVNPVRLVDLKLCHCRWPLDMHEDCDGADRLFCGSNVVEGSSYCGPHRKLSIRPQQASPKQYEKSTARLAAYLDRRAARA